MALREFHGRQIFIEDSRKTAAVYNLFSSAEVDLARRAWMKSLQLGFLAANLFPFCEVESNRIKADHALNRKRGCFNGYFVSPTSQTGSFVGNHEKSFSTYERKKHNFA